METIKVKTSDNQEFQVPKDVMFQSVLVKNMFGDLEVIDDALPLPNVTSHILQKVIEYCKHHKDDPAPPPEDENKPKTSDDIDDWDREFINVDQGTLFEIILAANYLDIQLLLDLGCKTVANMIKGKSVEEIRKHFNIVNDFTPEEEEQIRKENEWCEDR